MEIKKISLRDAEIVTWGGNHDLPNPSGGPKHWAWPRLVSLSELLSVSLPYLISGVVNCIQQWHSSYDFSYSDGHWRIQGIYDQLNSFQKQGGLRESLLSIPMTMRTQQQGWVAKGLTPKCKTRQRSLTTIFLFNFMTFVWAASPIKCHFQLGQQTSSHFIKTSLSES